MTTQLTASPFLGKKHISITLPGSKSQSNRVLILCHQLGIDFNQIENLSHSRDTSILVSALLN